MPPKTRKKDHGHEVPSRTDLLHMTVDDLKQKLKACKLPTSGAKQILVNTLLTHITKQQRDEHSSREPHSYQHDHGMATRMLHSNQQHDEQQQRDARSQLLITSVIVAAAMLLIASAVVVQLVAPANRKVGSTSTEQRRAITEGEAPTQAKAGGIFQDAIASQPIHQAIVTVAVTTTVTAEVAAAAAEVAAAAAVLT